MSRPGEPALAQSAAVPPQRFGRVGVLYGGRSSERDISLLSGSAVLRALQQCGVNAAGFDPAAHSLAQLESAGFDRIFLVLHGRFGEDGVMQGVLEMLRIPYTGSGVQASAIAIDKATTKKIWESVGLPTPAWTSFCAGQMPGPELAHLGPELVVKPVSEGSTFGVTKLAAGDRTALDGAIAEALKFDSRVLIEERICGRELTCAVLGEGQDARALPLVEIRAPQANYDYHNKYFSDATEYLCPAPLDGAVAEQISQVCLQAYRAIGARGWGRIDLMLRTEGSVERPYLLELNTAPGMTDHSLVPMAARAAGMSFAQLVLQIL
ncbi:MAG TPA: D-alanine--D-alanine ligase, partial [Burkholderiaceae bacterium]|nr:D-alanine--D-alanine ligase [Burkholderiaceae bacterium]